MPSLTDRPNGIPSHVEAGTKGNILLKRNSNAYADYLQLRSDDKAVLDSILALMQTNSNHIILAGDTLLAVSEVSGYTVSSLRNPVARLAEMNFLQPVAQGVPAEYIVNPLFAIKGTESSIWSFIQAIQYKNDTPREVLIVDYETSLSTNF